MDCFLFAIISGMLPCAITYPPSCTGFAVPSRSASPPPIRICVSWSTSKYRIAVCNQIMHHAHSIPTIFDGCRPMEGSSSTYRTPVVRFRTARGKLHSLPLSGGQSGCRPVQATDKQVPDPSAVWQLSGKDSQMRFCHGTHFFRQRIRHTCHPFHQFCQRSSGRLRPDQFPRSFGALAAIR